MLQTAVVVVTAGILLALCVSAMADDPLDGLATIRRDATQGFSNAGWKYDRYKDLPSLDARKKMLVADLKGPGVIRHIHTTRHAPAELFARGIVLEIWFDDAKEPAVMSPLADFFGDGCNGASMNFSTPLVECAPWAYNCYFAMPFKARARVYLRNDTDRDTSNYSYVEWEPLSKWDPDQGYFHATYARRRFCLTPDTSETFLSLKGAGHVIGRQFSIRTDEPEYREFGCVMEGNNEIDIDGKERAIDYLGTEDSFTFSWGFRETFAGLRAGMPHVALGDRNSLSIYRFHDHMPLRFTKSLEWRINWQHETGMLGMREVLRKAAERGGCMVDYATVHYWYQDDPGGYQHQPLPEVNLRGNLQPVPEPELAAIARGLPVDERGASRFDAADDLKRMRVVNAWPGTHPFWIGLPQAKGGHPGNPNPGKSGILAVHAAGPKLPAYVLLNLKAPAGQKRRVRLVVSGDPYEAPGKSDFVLGVGVAEKGGVRWLGEKVIDAGTPPSDANWRALEFDLPPGGESVALVVRVAYGGAVAVMNEEAFFDEIAVVVAE